MENPPLKDQNVNGPRNQDQFIFDLHLAEYEALMTRNSYLLQVQYAFWPVALVILAITAQVWSTDKIGGRILTWGIFVSLLVIAIGWGEVLCDMLSNITYIEHDLRAKLSGLVNPEVFWQYEAFKDRERGKWPMLNELFAPGLAIIIFAIIVKQTWPLSHHEWLFASASIILIVRLWERWLKVIQLRRNFVQQKQEVGA